jgi:hypothetical protein
MLLKNRCTILPIAPIPLCGIPDADVVVSLYDLTLWLDSSPNYCLTRYNYGIRDLPTSSGSTVYICHLLLWQTVLAHLYKSVLCQAIPKTRPFSLSEFFIPILSEAPKTLLVFLLLEKLSTKFSRLLYTKPNLSCGLVIGSTPYMQRDG